MIKSALPFLGDSPHRLEILANNQKLAGSNQFVLSVSAAQETISQAMNDFDFTDFQATLKSIKDYAPAYTLPSHSTRLQSTTHHDFDENKFCKIGDGFVNYILQSLDDRLDTAAKEIVQNLCVFSCPSTHSSEELLKISEGITTIPAILSHLAKVDSEQCSVRFRVYQILGTLVISLNEAERTRSARCEELKAG
ncbi:unnamed protein product [Adineta ricciae]|uniref:Uncharacterized protein n=1 Tax=Adineta ricciae TaxID=249248 RepID=A0A815T5M1_ADIRI|nr:unnamed protein product [Adineta ricciae]CAF1501096.1 unnamed protein product [Adineta ricciae]